MSKTNRLKSNRPRSKADFYETPYGLIESTLKHCAVSSKQDRILDPGCGNGRWGKVLRNLGHIGELHGIDIREIPFMELRDTYDGWSTGDYLEYDNIYPYDLIVGNPPFSLAEEFVRKSHELLSGNGQILFLLRIEFLCSQKRYKGLWKEFPPISVHFLSRRPSFFSAKEGRKTTDMQEYAIFRWTNKTRLHGSFIGKWLMWEYDKVLDYER